MIESYGLIPGISDESYHGAKDVLSSTGARKVLACPARFRWERDNPPESKRAFDFGKLAHTLILGEGGEIVVVDAENWLTKAAKEQRNAAYEVGSIPVLRADYEAAHRMRLAVFAHETAAALLTEGAAELSGFFTDEPTGTALRFRPDWLTTLDGRVACIDAKTAVSADPAEFGRSVAKWGYHAQAQFYLRGLAAYGVEDARFLFVVVEKTPPYPVSVVELDDEAIREGERINRAAIDLYAECVRTDIWPAYGHNIHTVSLLPWATRATVQADAHDLITQLEGLTA